MMRLPILSFSLIANLLLLVPFALSSTDRSFPLSSTVYYWPLNSPSPLPLAQISYNSADFNLKSSISSYTPPTSKDPSSDLVRIGLYDPTTKLWRGSVSSSSIFSYEQVLLSLHIDRSTGEAFHVGVGIPTVPTTPTKGGKDSGEETRVLVQLVKPRPGPQPSLNKPVILDAEGKVPEKEPEKSFFQKYWWLFLVVAMIAISGGGGDK